MQNIGDNCYRYNKVIDTNGQIIAYYNTCNYYGCNSSPERLSKPKWIIYLIALFLILSLFQHILILKYLIFTFLLNKGYLKFIISENYKFNNSFIYLSLEDAALKIPPTI